MTSDFRKALLWISLLVVGVYFVGRYSPREDDAELNRLVARNLTLARDYRSSLDSARNASDGLTQKLARMRAEALRGVGEAYTARQAVTRQDSLLRLSLGAADSVVALVGIVETLRKESQHLWQVVGALQRVADSLDADRLNWRRLAERAAAVNDSLAAALQTVNAARRCRILVVPCPNRVSSAVLGTVVGAVVVGVLRE